MKITTTFKELQSVFLQSKAFMSKDKTRYYLNSIYLQKTENDTWEVTATDGSCLSKIHLKLEGWKGEYEEKGYILDSDFVNDVCKIKVKKPLDTQEVILNIEDGKCDLEWTGGIIRGRLVDATYPETSHLFPASPVKHTARLCPKYLLDICQSAIKSGASSINVSVFDEEGPVLITNSADVRYLLMPRRY